MPSVSSNLTSSIAFTPTWDLLFLIGAAVAVFLYGMTSGKGKVLVLLLSTYFSFFITALAPWRQIGEFLNQGKNFPSATFEVFVFLALVLAFCFLIPHSAIGLIARVSKGGRSAWWQIGVFSVLEAGFLSVAILSFLPAKDVAGLNPLINQFFTGEMPKFIWTLLPVLAIVFLRRGRVE